MQNEIAGDLGKTLKIFAYFTRILYLCSQITAVMKKVLNIREPNVYARHLEAEVLHPLISVVHFDELE